MSTRGDLGSTELADVDRCEMLYHLKHVLGLALLVQPDFRLLGTLIHIVLRYYYAQFLLGGPPAWWHSTSLYDELERIGRGRPKLIEQAKRVGAAYVENYYSTDSQWRVLAVEEQIAVPLGEIDPRCPDYPAKHADDDTIVTVRPDVIAERPDGVALVRDYKGQAGQWGRLAQWTDNNEYGLGWQPMEYLYIARLRVPNVGGFWVDRIKRTEPYEFDRHPISPTPEAYASVPRIIRRQVIKRRLLREHGSTLVGLGTSALTEYLYGLGSYWACWERYGACDYYQLCRSSNKEAALKLYGREERAAL